MALDYAKCAREIFEGVGGRENLVSAAHCATRLRLVTVDNSKFDMKKLEDIEGVKGVFSNNGQLQLIIGTGTVNKVYEEFLAVSGMTAATKEDVKAAAAAQQPLPKRMVKALGDVFVPILPAIVASGLLMGIVEALGKIESLHFSETAWYGFLDMMSNTAFAFLPAIVAISAARVFGGNIFLGAVMGLMMVHPGLVNAWNAGSTEIATWNLFGDWQIGDYVVGSVNQVGYQGHVIPVIIAVWLMCQIEKWLHKHVPEMIDLFVTPITTVFLTALATFVVIGPVFSLAENYVLKFAGWIVQNPFGALLLGAIYPLTVVMGLHHMYNTIEAGMLSSVGLNTWMPIASSANFAQFGACLAVGIKTKKSKTRSVAVPSSMSAALGITEPAIFGINFRFMKPFICAMIGGACGAIFGAVTQIGATAYGVTGIPGFLTINNLAVYGIMLAISGGIAFILTWIIWREEAEELTPEQAAALAGEGEAGSADIPAIETKDNIIYAPLKGNVIPYDQIPDPTFASGVLGKGVGIEPAVGEVVAPFDGTVSSVTDTKHAIGITGPRDMELLIHVGVDTVNMKGDGFDMHVGEGDAVKAGQKLISFDIGKIQEAGYSPTTAVLLTNSDDYENFAVTKTGASEELEPIVEI